MSAKLKPYFPCLLLVIAVLTLFWPALLHPSAILYPTFSPFSDVMVIHWPKARLMAQSWQAGQGLPYWTPLILSGMPLAANQLAMLFYPPAWLLLFLPSEPVFNLLFVFHLLLGGLGVYLLLRRAHGLSSGAALLGGLTFALNGKWLAHAAAGHVSMVGAIAWMPWTLFGLHMLLHSQPTTLHPPSSIFHLLPRLGWAGLVAVSLAMQMVTHTLPVIYSVYLIIAAVAWYLVFEEARRGGGEEKRRGGGEEENTEPLDTTHHAPHTTHHVSRFTLHVSRFAFHLALPLLAIPVLAGLLGAVQLLPLLELARFSNRSLSLGEAADFALSPGQLLAGLLLPSARGGHEWVIYLGLAPLLLAPFGLSRSKRWSWFYAMLFVFTGLFALGPYTPLHSLFYHFIPGFQWVRTPARMFFVGALAVAALVGFGADRLAQQTPWSPQAKRWLIRLTVGVAPAALLVGLGLAFGFGRSDPAGALSRAALALALIIPAGLILILLRAQRLMSASLTLTLFGLLLFVDLAWFDLSLLRFVSLDEALAPGRPAAEYLARKSQAAEVLASADLQLFRIYSPSYSLPLQTAAAYDLSLADGVEPVHLAVYDQYMARAGGYNEPGFSVTIPNFGNGPLETALSQTRPDLKLLGLLNVAYLVSAFPMEWPGLTLETEIADTFIYRNEKAQPRAWVVYQTVPIAADWLAQLETLPDLATVATVASGPQLAGPAQASGPARITHYSANRIEVETSTTGPSWLVFSEIWYPGWQAAVNGSPQPVEQVNGLLRGLYLETAGDYHISLIYRPQSVIWGSWLTGLTAILVILAGLLTYWRLKS